MPGTGSGLEGPLWRALLVFRITALGYAAVLMLNNFRHYAWPPGGWLIVGLMAVWTAVSSLAYARPERRGWPLLTADLAVAAGCLLASRWIVAPAGLGLGAPTLPMAWVAAPVVAWAISGGRRRGAIAAILLSAADVVVRNGFSQATANGPVLMILAGIGVGHIARLAIDAESRMQQAIELEAATRERERLARGIHDSVLQVLALVQRRAAELGGEAAELGRLAGEQEAVLRTLVTSAPPPQRRPRRAPNAPSSPTPSAPAPTPSSPTHGRSSSAPSAARPGALTTAPTPASAATTPTSAAAPMPTSAAAPTPASSATPTATSAATTATPTSPAAPTPTSAATPTPASAATAATPTPASAATTAAPTSAAAPTPASAATATTPTSATAATPVSAATAAPGFVATGAGSSPVNAGDAPRAPAGSRPASAASTAVPARSALARRFPRLAKAAARRAARGTPPPGTGPAPAELADLRTLLDPYGSATVTIAAPATQVLLPSAVAAEVTAAVAAALDNVTRHAGGDVRAWILLEDLGDSITVTVRDNGRGIPDGRLAEAERAGRLGVAQSIRGRVRDLGGTVAVTSTPGAGTEVELNVPK
ncbi:DUF5931 domain-containing protein [Dactylosporangium sp. NPDC051485]|uniref:DUF5931 domain-containing protein n=1 Tax=Dactylosporangium sp. NPDC051485 TaxID=3154846 RepID=UPI0034445D51